MDTNPTLPEDLKILSEEDLTGHRTRIEARAAELRETAESGELTDDTLAEIERLADERDQITAETDRRTAEATDRQARAQAGLTRLSGEGGPGEGEGEGEGAEGKGEGEGEGEGAEGEPGAGRAAAATEPTLVALPAETVAALTQLAQLATTGAIPDRSATPARTKPRSPAELAAARPSANRPKPQKQADGFMSATAHSPVREGSDLMDRKAVADLMADASQRMGHVPSGVSGDRVSMACARKEMNGEMLSNDPTKNFGILRDAVESALVASAGDPDGLVASGGGGYCNIYTPMYDFYRLAERQSPLEDDLPTIPAPRAGIQYMQPMDWRSALGAVGTQTKAQITAKQIKSFLAMTCPQILTAEVIAVYQIVQFDNLQFKVFTEQAEAFLEDVAVAFDYTKESYYLAQIASKSTSVSSCVGYGASRSLLWDWVTAGVEYRKRNAMRRDSTLKLYAPDWSLDVVKLDMAMDNQEGQELRGITDAEVIAQLKAHNFDPVFYNDLLATTGQIAAPQAAGQLHAWPKNVKSYIHSPGTFGRLDAGTLDVGLVRDSVLNGTNDVQFFMEEWLGMAFLGIESIELVSCACPSGVAPNYGTPIAC